MKRIYIIGSKGPYSLGGYETCVRCLGPELVELGYEVYVTSESSPADDDRLDLSCNIVHMFKEPKSISPFQRILYDLYAAYRSVRDKADIVYMLGYNAAWVLVIPLLFGKKVFVNSDGIEWARPSWGKNPIKRNYLKLNERLMKWLPMTVISDSKEVASFLQERIDLVSHYSPYGGDSFSYVESSSDHEVLENYALTSGAYYFISVRIVEDNFVDALIEAFQDIPTKLVIIGAMPETEYGQKIRSMLHDNVIILDMTSMNPEYNLIRHHAKANIHSHRFGGTSPNLVEVMALRVPIIAFDTVYSREVVGDNALFYDSAETLVEQLLAFENTQQTTVDEWVEANYASVEQRYNWAAVARGHAEIFER